MKAAVADTVAAASPEGIAMWTFLALLAFAIIVVGLFLGNNVVFGLGLLAIALVALASFATYRRRSRS